MKRYYFWRVGIRVSRGGRYIFGVPSGVGSKGRFWVSSATRGIPVEIFKYKGGDRDGMVQYNYSSDNSSYSRSSEED